MLNPITITSILRTIAFPALISMGMVQLMIAGEIDLSTAAVMSFCAVLTAKLVRDFNFGIPEAVIISLLCSLLIGFINAFLTVKIGIFSVIATIGTGFVVRGSSYLFTNGLPIYPLPESFAFLGSLRPFNISFTFFFNVGCSSIRTVTFNIHKVGNCNLCYWFKQASCGSFRY